MLRIFLFHNEPAVFPLCRHSWHTATFHPCLAKLPDATLRRFAVEDVDKLIPCSIAIGILMQILADPVSQRLLSHLLLQLAHHDWCLAVDDVAIEQSSLVEVVERLLYGMRAGSTVC